MPTGRRPNCAASRIWRSLDDYEQTQGGGVAVADNAGFTVNLPRRESFSPDAAWYIGSIDTADEMDFFNGAPAFAAEFRSKNDYGRLAEAAIAAKRRDYFAAGALVVWDLDLLSEDVIKAYRADQPETPTIYRRGDLAAAEPAVPAWQMPVDELFR
jgi:Uma2 family endonuclease